MVFLASTFSTSFSLFLFTTDRLTSAISGKQIWFDCRECRIGAQMYVKLWPFQTILWENLLQFVRFCKSFDFLENAGLLRKRSAMIAPKTSLGKVLDGRAFKCHRWLRTMFILIIEIYFSNFWLIVGKLFQIVCKIYQISTQPDTYLVIL